MSIQLLAARLSLAGGVSPRSRHHRLLDDFNPDGSTLLLRPSAPVYCCDLDPAALGGVGTHTAPAAVPDPGSVSSTAQEPPLPGFSATDGSIGAASGVAGIGSRCGYRAVGFGPPVHNRPSSSSGPSSSHAAGVDGASGAAQPSLHLSVPLRAPPTGET